MKRIRQAITCLCLATIFSVSVPSMAASAESSQTAEPASPLLVQPAAKLDLSQLRKTATWSARAMASPEAPMPLKVQMQTSGKGWSSFSTAKKTWIIVGSVLGAAVVVAAVSNSGGGGGGGGGGY